MLRVLLSERELKNLRDEAERRGMSNSDVIRQYLLGLEKREAKRENNAVRP